jgi:ribosomal protein L32
MKREKRLTKRERKAQAPAAASAGHAHAQHIHCVACGRHIDQHEFSSGDALMISCKHGSTFPSCVECRPQTVALLAEHDRSGQAVRTAGAWH